MSAYPAAGRRQMRTAPPDQRLRTQRKQQPIAHPTTTNHEATLGGAATLSSSLSVGSFASLADRIKKRNRSMDGPADADGQDEPMPAALSSIPSMLILQRSPKRPQPPTGARLEFDCACGKVFHSPASLRSHKGKCKLVQAPFVCEHGCGFDGTELEVSHHELTCELALASLHTCECGKSFDTIDSLHGHKGRCNTRMRKGTPSKVRCFLLTLIRGH